MKCTLVALLTLLALTLPSALAGHCGGWSTSHPEVAQNGLYVDNDLCQLELECIASLWVYQETNGIPGLQRSDPQVDDTCHGMVPADRRLI
jgi:hypothetical protein